MINLEDIEHNQTSEKLVDILCKKTQNPNPLFFRVLVAYYFSKVASMMRCNINTHDRGVIPVNLYAINLASSGQGKGHSTNIVEEHVIDQFRDRFLSETFHRISEHNLAKLANERAARKGADPDAELLSVQKEFATLGQLAFSFDSGTPAAVKQMRHKLLMANAGSMNMEIDEIGSNLLGQMEVINTFLELYDVGKIKQKLIKNTAESVRSEEIIGRTPTNMMLFGTPSKLLNGGRVEEEFYSMLDAGYARRCLFGFAKETSKAGAMSAEERYKRLTDTSSDTFLTTLSDQLAVLADMVNFGVTLQISKEVSVMLIEYQINCENIANALRDHQEMERAEVSHRYFKALKLAGTYAFIEGSADILEEHLMSAIKVVEESGKAFKNLLTRDRNYVKLAKYIASIGREVTHVDLTEDLPFYKGSESQKRELMSLATAYGYKNNIIIKKVFNDGIEFLRGESLKETNLDDMVLSYSNHIAYNYQNETAPFDDLSTLTQAPNMHWCNHHFIGGHRNEENVVSKFNMIVLDVDSGVSIDTARLLLAEYKYHMHTTKRHQTPDCGDRFRIILPLSHELKMDASEYKEFMSNVFEWLPFNSDEQTNQRARKWMSHPGQFYDNDGELLDVLQFIPKTTKNEERKKVVDSQQSLSNLERWFVHNTGIGNRSNQLIKFALMLVDSGMDIDTVRGKVLELNNKLPDKMSEVEILNTIMVSAAKAVHQRTP